MVVATATKALQDQLATKDLPFLADTSCTELRLGGPQGAQQLRVPAAAPRDGVADRQDAARARHDGAHAAGSRSTRIAEWAGATATGDMAEMEWTPSDNAWRAVSVGSDECPGADRCPLGDPCFAEQARRRAAAADVIVVNTHLYGLDVASGGAILPEHDVVVFDEAHVLEDMMSDTVGVEIAPGRFTAARPGSSAGSSTTRRSDRSRRSPIAPRRPRRHVGTPTVDAAARLDPARC